MSISNIIQREDIALLIGDVSPCYQAKVEGICKYLKHQGYTIFLVTPKILNDLDSSHYGIMIAIHANTIIDFCLSHQISCSYTISMATYLPDSLSNDIGKIRFPSPIDPHLIKKVVHKQAYFISEHEEKCNKYHFDHHITFISKVISIPWCFTEEEIILLSDFKEHIAAQTDSKFKSQYIFLAGLIQEKKNASLSSLKRLSDLSTIKVIGPDAHLAKIVFNTIKSRQCYIKPTSFLHYLLSNYLCGGIPLSIHHDFELLWKSTYNERSFKSLASGLPLITDNPYALMKNISSKIVDEIKIDNNRSLYTISPNTPQESAKLFNYKSLLPGILNNLFGNSRSIQ